MMSDETNAVNAHRHCSDDCLAQAKARYTQYTTRIYGPSIRVVCTGLKRLTDGNSISEMTYFVSNAGATFSKLPKIFPNFFLTFS